MPHRKNIAAKPLLSLINYGRLGPGTPANPSRNKWNTRLSRAPKPLCHTGETPAHSAQGALNGQQKLKSNITPRWTSPSWPLRLGSGGLRQTRGGSVLLRARASPWTPFLRPAQSATASSPQARTGTDFPFLIRARHDPGHRLTELERAEMRIEPSFRNQFAMGSRLQHLTILHDIDFICITYR